MTDIPSDFMSVPTRLGSSAHLDGDEFTIEVLRQPATLHLGAFRASVLAFAIDAVAGILIDRDPEIWAFTTDMTVRMRAIPAPRVAIAHNTILREGRRSVTCKVDIVDEDGSPVATGALGFARVPRKPSDPPKITLTPEDAPLVFRDLGTLSLPLREEAGIEVLDPELGILQLPVTPRVVNPAGTLQGAMVALLAEAAVEDLLYARFGAPVLVTDLDLRYLAKAMEGPVRTRTRLLGHGPEAPVEVELVDSSNGTLTTLVHARAVTMSGERA